MNKMSEKIKKPTVDCMDCNNINCFDEKKVTPEKFVIPAWMKPYAKMILNTGGNSIEDLMNDDGKNSNIFNNAPRALICTAVKSQVQLLAQLYARGLLMNLTKEDYGLICDAIEIAIGDSDYNQQCNERFEGMQDIMKELVKSIETQSGCQTRRD